MHLNKGDILEATGYERGGTWTESYGSPGHFPKLGYFSKSGNIPPFRQDADFATSEYYYQTYAI